MNKFYVTNLPAVILYRSRQKNSIKLMLRRTLVRSVLYSAFSLAIYSLQAQKLLTLEDAVSLALKNNYDIQL